MRIRSFHIDGFGIFSKVSIDAVAPGLSIFLGDNEAGKSTCLEFFRSILTGYPDYRSKEARERSMLPLQGGLAGGSMALETHQFGLVQLTRRPGNGGGAITLADANGNTLDMNILDRLLAGVTREVYRNVFGFSLAELQTFDSLNSENVRHALYGASFGMGLRTPGQVLKQFEDNMESIFKGGGKNPLLNAALRDWDAVQQQISEAEKAVCCYDALNRERDDCQRHRDTLRHRKEEIEQKRQYINCRLGVWRQWDEWRNAKNRLERLEPVASSFPHDAATRMERAIQNVQENLRLVHITQERVQRTQSQHDAITVHEALLNSFPQLTTLAETKSSYRHAITTLPIHKATHQNTQAELQRLLVSLGPQWTCERIAQTDRSLFAREDIERRALAMQTQHVTHIAAISVLDKANRAVDYAEHALAEIQAKLEGMHFPEAPLDDTQRENARATLAHMEELLQQLPRREQARATAQATFMRMYAPLNFADGVPPLQALQTVLQAQDKAIALAEQVHTCVNNAEQATHALAQLHIQEESLKARNERLRLQQRTHQGATRNALDIRAAALRALRQVHNTFCVTRDRKTEIETRLNTMPIPAPSKSVLLMLIGGVLILLGAGILFAHWQLHMSSFAITPTLHMPITLWSGYLVIVAGVAFLAGGLPRSGSEAKRHKMEYQELQARNENTRLHMVELEARMLEQCVLAEVTDAEPVTLDAAELLLMRERENCVADEHIQVEIATLEAEFVLLRTRIREAQQNNAQMDAYVQQARRRWHDFLESMHMRSIPSPEAAQTFFSRLETVQTLHDTMNALEKEVADIHHALAGLHEKVVTLPVMQELLQKTLNPTYEDTIAALHKVFHLCREADAAKEARRSVHTSLLHATTILDSAVQVQAEAGETLQQSENNYGAAQSAWEELLTDIGLGVHLLPATVREALECMERCLNLSAESVRMHHEQQRLEQEISVMETAVDTLREQLRYPAFPPNTPCVQQLETFIHDAHKAEKAVQEKTSLVLRLTELQDELLIAQSAYTDAEQAVQALLHHAQADSTEDFSRLASIHTQRHDVLQRMHDLEDALYLAAGNTPLEEFLASFEGKQQAESEQRVTHLQQTLEALTHEEQETQTCLATLGAQLHNLVTAEHLATLRQQEADITESISILTHNWCRYALARQLLLQAKQRFEQERQPHVIRLASEIFATITENRWKGLVASLEDSRLHVIPPHGEPVVPEHLSRGTQEQIYLAMRLAYIRNHSNYAAPLPVIMDDILVNFDPTRAYHTAKAIVNLASGEHGKTHQVFFFTCHPHTADMLLSIQPQSAHYILKQGSIYKA